jgi:hypothetical protein
MSRIRRSTLALCWSLPDLLQIEFVRANYLGHRLYFNRRAQRIAPFCFVGSPESKTSVPVMSKNSIRVSDSRKATH